LDEKLKENLHRIFQERGLDFFDDPSKRFIENVDTQKPKEDGQGANDKEDELDARKPMTYEELDKMRMELLPQLQ